MGPGLVSTEPEQIRSICTTREKKLMITKKSLQVCLEIKKLRRLIRTYLPRAIARTYEMKRTIAMETTTGRETVLNRNEKTERNIRTRIIRYTGEDDWIHRWECTNENKYDRRKHTIGCAGGK